MNYYTIPVYATKTPPELCVSSDIHAPIRAKAREMMEAWYQDNIGHPYASKEIVDYISKHGNVTTTQVRKWMANKRARSCNTHSYKRTIHPKRLKRLQRDAAGNKHTRERH